MAKELYVFTFILLLTGQAIAHGDLDEKIKNVSKEIKSNPDSAFLYLKRGELYFLHEDFKESIEDFTFCSTLGYEAPRLYLGFAKTYDRIEKFDSALLYVDKCLVDNTFDINALRLKGQILFKTKEFAQAAKCFEKVIKFSNKTFPEIYIDASFAWENSNRKDALQKASEIIYIGIKDLGELLVFYNRLIELYLGFKDYETTLTYQTKVIENSHRKESVFYQRALIYIEIGDGENAKNDLKMSLSAIDQLPQRIQNNQAMIDLKSNIQQLLKKL